MTHSNTPNGQETYAEMAARIGVSERDIRVAALGWYLKGKKPETPDEICMAGARWIYPYIAGEK